MHVDGSIRIRFRLNGQDYVKEVPPDLTLLRFLREQMGHTGVKCGCEIGECGACTVLFDGRAVNSCLILAAQADGADIWTIEGVVRNGRLLHPVQQAFVESDAVHCGFCTPGMVMTTIALLIKNPHPQDDQIKTALAGNLCRCSGYVQIINAVKRAAELITDEDLRMFMPPDGGQK